MHTKYHQLNSLQWTLDCLKCPIKALNCIAKHVIHFIYLLSTYLDRTNIAIYEFLRANALQTFAEFAGNFPIEVA